MAVGVRWRKAVALSVLMHVVLLTGVGLMAGRQPAREPAEKYVELEMINQPYSAVGPAADNTGRSARFFAPAAALPVPAAARTPLAVVPDTVVVPAGGPVAAGPAASPSAAGDGTTAASPVSGVKNRTPDMAWIMEAFARRLEEKKDYPYIARKRGQTGTVLVRVRLLPGGELEGVTVVSSSGVDRLDEAALKLIRDVCPFEHGTGRLLAVTVPITYDLKE